MIGEVVSISDTGEHQQLRAVDGTPAEHHLAAGVGDAWLTVALVFHADRPGPVDASLLYRELIRFKFLSSLNMRAGYSRLISIASKRDRCGPGE